MSDQQLPQGGDTSSKTTDEVKRHQMQVSGQDPEAGLSEQTPINPQVLAGGNQSSGGGYSLGKFYTRFDPIAIVFTVLVFAGGVVGYITKQSTSSLVAGTIFAVLLAATTFLEGSRKNPYPLLVVLLSIGLVMGYRYSLNLVFMPSGLVALLAVIVFARHSYLLYLRRNNARTE